MEPSSTTPFRFPGLKPVQVITVELADGSIVKRAPEQLSALPRELLLSIDEYTPPPPRAA